jgi:hypothetical protein
MTRLVLLAAAIVLAPSRPAEARRLPWCGFYMMHLKHKTDRRLALARSARANISCRGCTRLSIVGFVGNNKRQIVLPDRQQLTSFDLQD